MGNQGDFLRTDELAVGMVLSTQDGDGVSVIEVIKTTERAPTYNLTVADAHTFFVGNEGDDAVPNASVSAVDSPANEIIVHPFSDGGSAITTQRNLDIFADPKKFPNHGPDTGQFITPSRDLDRLLQNSQNRADIERQLGLGQGQLDNGTPLIRIDIPDPLNRNLRTPDPATGNEFHMPNSGRTPGGQREAVIDPPSKKDDTISIAPISDP